MALQVLIIGLGQFGMSIAKTLADKGAEIVGVDIDKDNVNIASAFLDDVICMDATEENALMKLSPEKRDIVICAIGSKESSILSTALLIEMGCSNVIARATDKIHERILKSIGAHRIINPDAEYGKRLAYKIMFQNVVSNDMSEDIQSLEINVQPFMVGKNLVELALPNKYGIIVAAIKRDNKITRPFPNEKLKETDKLILICNEEAIEKMLGDNQ